MTLRYRNAKDGVQRSDAAIALMTWARDILNVDDDTVVKVAHPHCGDPDCGDDVTTILLLRPDRPTSMIKIEKSLETVTKADLRAALLPIAGHAPHRTSQREP
jgi:hypothetical protein